MGSECNINYCEMTALVMTIHHLKNSPQLLRYAERLVSDPGQGVTEISLIV